MKVSGMCMCIGGLDFDPVSTIFRVCYFSDSVVIVIFHFIRFKIKQKHTRPSMSIEVQTN